MKIHKNIIYNTFRCNTLGKNETLNDILRGTKSILTSKNGFKNYIHNYNIFTKEPTFKNPNITDYPLVKTESAFLVPIKKRNNNNSENNPKKNRILPKHIQINSNHLDFMEKYNKRFYQFLNLKTEPKRIRINKTVNETKFKRYNSLFLDFFNKWRKKNYNNKIYNYDNNKKIKINKDKLKINMTNFNIKERYSKLHYDENEIFNNNYEKFILNKIRDIKENKIKNYISYIESSFNDINEKEIKLKLESIKLNFYPLSNNDNINNNKFSIYIPLSYVFLFYYNNFDFFQKILMSILYFDKDYKNIIFKDDELYNLLDTINTNTNEKEENKEEKDTDYLATFKKDKKTINSQNNLVKGNDKLNILDKKDTIDKEFRKTFNKHNNFMNKLFSRKSSGGIIKDDNRKIKIIHSNILLRKKYQTINNEENKNNILNNNENIIKNNKETPYNIYYFMWETPKISYKIKMEMPKIYFLYEDIEYNISTFCEKNLFLYLYQHNFINWDFYVLNYIFSIKSFRKFILQFFSFSEYAGIKNLKMNINTSQIKNLRSISTYKNKNKINLYNFIEEKNDIKNNENKKILLLNKKINNQMNENNESYIFFYTDLNLKNYILHFYSYHINIEYQKLNPKLKWEFLLNFKQMKYLNKVSKYETLISFLPKIIKTDFEYGKLDINFNVFDDNFDIKIFNTSDKANPIIKKNPEINIEISMPYVEIEKYFTGYDKKEKIELNYNFLQSLNEMEIDNWSKQILLLINNNDS